jgi:hypothetical protein
LYIRCCFINPASDKYALIETEIFGEGENEYKAQTGWKLQRAEEVTASGEALSRLSYDDSAWLDAVVPGTALPLAESRCCLKPDIGDISIQCLTAILQPITWYRAGSLIYPIFKKGRRVWLNFNAVNWESRCLFKRSQAR